MTRRSISADDLRALYPPLAEDVAIQMKQALARLPQQKEETPMRKRLSLGLVLAVVLALLAAGALAAAVEWGVMDFLFGSPKPQAEALVRDLHADVDDGQVSLHITSALCDGKTLALDWTVANARPEAPVYLLIDEFTANGQRLSTDGTDGFAQNWLPGWMGGGDSELRDGENVRLPEGIAGDTLDVSLRVGVYRPKAPIYYMEAFDAALAAQKLAEGYYVLAEGDGFVIDDPVEGVIHCFGGIPEGEAERYTRTELRVDFSLDLAAARASQLPLQTQAEYDFPTFTARYTEATLTPAALYLAVEIRPKADADAVYDALFEGDFEATDADGVPLELPWPEGEMYCEPAADGLSLVAWKAWFGVARDDLPEVLSFTWLADAGTEKYVLPVAVP